MQEVIKEAHTGLFWFHPGEAREYHRQHPDVKFAYLCDGHERICSCWLCGKASCNPECNHTTNYDHAITKGQAQLFERLPNGNFIEVA